MAMHLLSAVIFSLVGYGLVSLQGCSPSPSEPYEPGSQCCCGLGPVDNAMWNNSTEEECNSRPERANLSEYVPSSEWMSGVGAACAALSTYVSRGADCLCGNCVMGEGRLYNSSKGACKAGVIYGQTS